GHQSNGQLTRSLLQEATESANGVVAGDPFNLLSAGRPLLDQFSARYLRDVGMYVYEDPAGEVHAVISSDDQLPLVQTVAWTLQRKVLARLASKEDIATALGRTSDAEPAQASNGSFAAIGRSDGEEDAVETLRDLASGAPVVRAVNEIIELAL